MTKQEILDTLKILENNLAYEETAQGGWEIHGQIVELYAMLEKAND